MKNMNGHNLCWMNLIQGVKKEEKRSKNTKKEGLNISTNDGILFITKTKYF